MIKNASHCRPLPLGFLRRGSDARQRLSTSGLILGYAEELLNSLIFVSQPRISSVSIPQTCTWGMAGAAFKLL